MSDLAKFVDAVLRDNPMADLLRENERLRPTAENRRQVTVTAKGGDPVLARGNINMGNDDGVLYDEDSEGGDGEIHVELRNTDAVGNLRVSKLREVEVRLGGVLIHRLGGCSDEGCAGGAGDDCRVYAYEFGGHYRDGSNETACLRMEYGPIPERARWSVRPNMDPTVFRDDEITMIKFTDIYFRDYHDEEEEEGPRNPDASSQGRLDYTTASSGRHTSITPRATRVVLPPPDSPTMSDLAKIVAATLTDKAKVDLHEENERLRATVEKRSEVTVTARGGDLVLARGSIGTDAGDLYDEDSEDGDREIYVQLCNTDAVGSLRVSDLDEVEVHLGGVLINRLGGSSDETCVGGAGDEYSVYIYELGGHYHDMIYRTKRTAFLEMEYGPIPDRARYEREHDMNPKVFRHNEITQIKFNIFSFEENYGLEAESEEEEEGEANREEET